MPSPEPRFEIAFSFAGDGKRDKVREVAKILLAKVGDGKVFFDEWFEHESAGMDSDLWFQDIYQNRSLLVVVCVCQNYDENQWTQDEWRAIRELEKELRGPVKRLRFLPLRFGIGEVQGLFSSAIVPDCRERNPNKIADFITERLVEYKKARKKEDAREALRLRLLELVCAKMKDSKADERFLAIAGLRSYLETGKRGELSKDFVEIFEVYAKSKNPEDEKLAELYGDALIGEYRSSNAAHEKAPIPGDSLEKAAPRGSGAERSVAPPNPRSHQSNRIGQQWRRLSEDDSKYILNKIKSDPEYFQQSGNLQRFLSQPTVVDAEFSDLLYKIHAENKDDQRLVKLLKEVAKRFNERWAQAKPPPVEIANLHFGVQARRA